MTVALYQLNVQAVDQLSNDCDCFVDRSCKLFIDQLVSAIYTIRWFLNLLLLII